MGLSSFLKWIINLIGPIAFSNISVAGICVFAIWSYFIFSKVLIAIQNDIASFLKEFSIKEDQDILHRLRLLADTKNSHIAANVKEVINKYERNKNVVNQKLNPYEIIILPAKRNQAELIPGFLTALGILGTFIGLVAGLPNSGGNISELTNNISQLVGGMSLAFTTSIAGIIASIIWNYKDKRNLRKVNNGLYQLNEKFHELFDKKDLDDRLAILEDLTRQQTQALRSLSTDFAAELQNVLVPSIKSGLRETFNETMSPSIDRMEKVITDFTLNASEKQTDGVGQIVEKFVDAMNQALNGQFENLSTTIKELCEWQKQTAHDLELLIQEIKKTSINQVELNYNTERILNQFSEYFDNLHTSTESLLGQVEQLGDISENLKVNTESSMALFTEVINRYQSIDESNRTYLTHTKDLIENMRAVWIETNDLFKENSKQFDDSTKEFGKSLHSGLSKTFEEFDKHISDFTRYFNGNIENINQTAEELSALLVDANSQLKGSIQDLNISIKAIPKTIEIETDRIKVI